MTALVGTAPEARTKAQHHFHLRTPRRKDSRASHLSRMPKPPPVTRAARAIDLLSLTLVVGGAICYVWAYNGMRGLPNTPQYPDVELFARYTRWVRLSRLANAGLGVTALGIVT